MGQKKLKVTTRKGQKKKVDFHKMEGTGEHVSRRRGGGVLDATCFEQCPSQHGGGGGLRKKTLNEWPGLPPVEKNSRDF